MVAGVGLEPHDLRVMSSDLAVLYCCAMCRKPLIHIGFYENLVCFCFVKFS